MILDMMADLSTIDEVLRSTREFLEKTNEFTERNEEQLKNMKEVKEALQSMVQEKEQENGNQLAVAVRKTVKNACENVVFSNYLEAKTTQAAVSDTVKKIDKEMEDPESAKLPGAMRIKVNEVKDYLKQAGEVMVVVDNIISRIKAKVEQAQDKEFNLTDKERIALERDTTNLQRELVTCKAYLDQANKVIKMLESDIWEEKKKYGVLAGIAVAATIFVGISRALWQAFYNVLTLGGNVFTALHSPSILCGAAAVAGTVALLVWKGWFSTYFNKAKNYCRLPQKVICFWLHLSFAIRSHSNLMQESHRISLTLKEMRDKLVFC